MLLPHWSVLGPAGWHATWKVSFFLFPPPAARIVCSDYWQLRCGGAVNDNSHDNTYDVGSQSSHPHIQLIVSSAIYLYWYSHGGSSIYIKGRSQRNEAGKVILSFDGRLLEVLCIFVYCDDVSLTWEQDAALSNYCCDRWTLGVLPTRIHLTEVKMSWQPSAKIVTWDLSNFEFNTQSRSTFFLKVL